MRQAGVILADFRIFAGFLNMPPASATPVACRRNTVSPHLTILLTVRVILLQSQSQRHMYAMTASLRSAVYPKTHSGQDDICVEMYIHRVSQADEELMA